MGKTHIKNVEFWARELRLPLFWLTDERHKIFRNDVLVLYKANVIHAYHLNDRRGGAAKRGFKYFSDPANVEKYRKQAALMIALIGRKVEAGNKIKVGKIYTKELKEIIFDLIAFLDKYSNLYAQTEPFVLAEIEANEKKYHRLIKLLGEIRLTLRKEGELVFYCLFGVFLKELAKRFDLKVSDLFFYDFNELKGLFYDHRVGKSIIDQRKKGYALVCQKNKRTILVGDEFKTLYRDIVLSTPKTDLISGRTVMAGKAKGVVRVILHNKRDLSKAVASFKKGEVLVTEMTRPDTIMACRKAAAIITDEGGITSHAAIISRELKIPCVIATKIATRVLKTGDRVEVDADKGTIMILR